MPQPSGPLQPVAPIGETAALSDIFAALADPIRRAIIVHLTGGPCSVTQLGAPFAVSAPAISKHLAVLERCGLIVRWKIGRVHYPAAGKARMTLKGQHLPLRDAWSTGSNAPKAVIRTIVSRQPDPRRDNIITPEVGTLRNHLSLHRNRCRTRMATPRLV